MTEAPSNPMEQDKIITNEEPKEETDVKMPVQQEMKIEAVKVENQVLPEITTDNPMVSVNAYADDPYSQQIFNPPPYGQEYPQQMIHDNPMIHQPQSTILPACPEMEERPSRIMGMTTSNESKPNKCIHKEIVKDKEGTLFYCYTYLVKNKNGEVVETWPTTEKAKEFTDLEVGEYTLEETKAPNGYRLSNVKRSFVVDFNGKTETIKYTNDKKDKTIVKVLKVDSKTGEALEKAELVIKDSEGKIVKTWTTTKNEEVFPDLDKGEYTLEETKAPEGYKKSDEKKSFVVDENDQTIELRFENEIKPGSVKISKQDMANGKELPGATLVVKNSEGKEVAKWVSTNEPHYINTLEDGTYTLSETIAPEGYELSTETISFEIVSGKVTDTVVMYNKLKPGSVTISKQDITNGEELPGANLEVKDSNGEVVAKWVSSTEPYKIETLEDGTYTLTETIAPKGYVLSSETIEFTITAGKVTDTVIMYNTPETPVPITASSISIFASMLGLSLLALGTKVVYKNVKQN